MSEEVWRVCRAIKFDSDKECKRCPATVEVHGQGYGVFACYALAEECANDLISSTRRSALLEAAGYAESEVPTEKGFHPVVVETAMAIAAGLRSLADGEEKKG